MSRFYFLLCLIIFCCISFLTGVLFEKIDIQAKIQLSAIHKKTVQIGKYQIRAFPANYNYTIAGAGDDTWQGGE